MARKSSREDKYIEQLKELGIYEPAFDPEIKTLATLEREWTAAKKEWSATAKDGGKPSFTDPLYSVIQGLRKEIHAHREALGLTPKSLRKLRGAPETAPQEDQIGAKLSAIAERVSAYTVPEFGSNTPGRQSAAVAGPYGSTVGSSFTAGAATLSPQGEGDPPAAAAAAPFRQGGQRHE